MRKKYITYAADKSILGSAFAEVDPNQKYHQIIDDNVSYKFFTKVATYSNGNKSLSMLKIYEHEAEAFLQPLIDGGYLECLGSVDDLACDYDDPSSSLTSDDWIKIREIIPTAGTDVEYEEEGITFTYNVGLFDIA